MRKRHIGTVLVAAVSVVVLGALVIHRTTDDGTAPTVAEGPLVHTSTEVSYTAIDTMHRRGYDVGDTFTDALLNYVEFDTREPVTITSVEPIGDPTALEYLGARVVQMPDGGFPYAGFDTTPGFPDLTEPTRRGWGSMTHRMWEALKDSEPAEGAVLTPSRWGRKIVNRPMLLLGWKLVEQVRSSTDGIRIDYEVDGIPYSQVLNRTLVYEPPRRATT